MIGGSQGAKAINDTVVALLPQLLKLCDVIHITGKGKQDTSIRVPGYWSTPFEVDQLADLYAAADVAVSRAGAGSICELAAYNIPMILVPLRDVAHDHQQRNAEYVQQIGGCVLLDPSTLPDQLLETVHIMLRDDNRQQMIQRVTDSMNQVDAARHIAEILEGCLA